MEKDLPANLEEIVEELKKSSVEKLVNYDMKTYFLTLIDDDDYGVNAEWEKCNEKLDEGKNADFNLDSLEPWEKMCCYKITPYHLDCDVSLRNMVIYSIAFSFVLENNRHIELQKYKNKDDLKYCFHSDDDNIFEYRGDTMNSYATTIHQYILANCSHEDVKFFAPVLRGWCGRKWGTVGYESFKEQHLEACILDNYDYFKAILPTEAKEFIRLNHTMGNFIPCPVGCNSPRGYNNSKIQDYWDLTLYYIYKWYDEKNDEFIEYIVKEKNVNNYKSWLNKFDNWDDFVEKNFLQDFVNDGNDGHKYGMPKELWEGHFNPLHSVLPENEDEFSQFFTNASARILARGTRIAIELKKKLDKEDFSEIVNKLLKNE